MKGFARVVQDEQSAGLRPSGHTSPSKKCSLCFCGTSGKTLKVLYIHQLILPSNVLESKVWSTVSHFKQVKVLAEKCMNGKICDYKIQTHPNGQQEMNSVGQKKVVGPEQAC